ncbi:MAG: alkaline phosphatase family protein [Bacteroidetes bacterium]|nr:MAG: alkaline phosphatase family protein [Bacteroidota bacterium]
MRQRLFSLLLGLLLLNILPAQPAADLLLSGPMVGYCEMREALLWVQTNGPAQVHFEYTAGPGSPVFKTPTYVTGAAEAYTARLIADQVKPGTRYTYQLFINNVEVSRPYPLTFQTPPLWSFRTDPPEMKIALGSCAYINDEPYDRPGTPYGGDYRIFESIQRAQPDMMLWLGDNNYLREADWFSRTGIIHRYTHSRAVPEMQALLASTANYAIWDDHDYGPNDSDYTYRDKKETLRAFQLFWGNPSYGLPGEGGITSSFVWGDAEFFLLDNRYFRDPNRKPGVRTILGESQLQWLLDALVSSNATFKFVCIGGQVVNDAAEFENYARIAPAERTRMLETITDAGIRNVIFLTGDRHHSELSLYEDEGVKIYDFTASPLTSGPHDASDEANTLRVEGSHVGIRNYGIMEISGPRTARALRFSLYDTDGKALWSHEIKAE